jgi:hypothetical protein
VSSMNGGILVSMTCHRLSLAFRRIPDRRSLVSVPFAVCSSKVDVVLEAGFASAFQQTKECDSFCRTTLSSHHDNDAVMRLPRRQLDEVVPVAGHQDATVFVRKLEDDRIGSFLLEHVAEMHNVVAQFLKQVGEILRYVVVEQELHR